MIAKLMIKLYGPSWKTSLNGDLALAIAVGTFLSGYLVVTPNSPRWMVILSSVATLIAAIGRQQTGRTQVDSGQTLAQLPNVAEPQLVESHETPFDPAAKPVPKP